jgi:hypothetical protein
MADALQGLFTPSQACPLSPLCDDCKRAAGEGEDENTVKGRDNPKPQDAYGAIYAFMIGAQVGNFLACVASNSRGGLTMQIEISEIIDMLPANEEQMLDASTPQLHTPAKRRLFDARTSLELIWLADGSEDVYQAFQLLPHDALHFEQVIAAAEGQSVVRENIAKAKKLLEEMEGK